MKKVIFLLILTVILSSCTHRLFDFTIISSKNVDLSKANTLVRGYTRTEGKDVAHIILFFPTGIPNLKDAVDRAIEKIPGCVALLDGVIKSRAFYFLVYGQSAYIIEGTPLIDPSINGGKVPAYSKIQMDKKGNVVSVTEISKEDYLKYKSNLSK